jgi:alpha-D-xyloside xylohydrolase
MRPLFFDFPDDPACDAVADEFLFGPDLLVAPILHQGLASREVHLPLGAKWIDPWTGREIEGGQTIQADAPLERIPLFVRNGRQLPIRA